MGLHLFQQGAARPDLQREPVAVCPAVFHIVDFHLDRLRRPFSLPVLLIHLAYILLRLGERHLFAGGETLIHALRDGHNRLALRIQVDHWGLRAAFREGRLHQVVHSGGNIVGKCFPLVRHRPDRTGSSFEKAGEQAGALAQQILYILFQIAGDLLHPAVMFHAASLLEWFWKSPLKLRGLLRSGPASSCPWYASFGSAAQAPGADGPGSGSQRRRSVLRRYCEYTPGRRAAPFVLCRCSTR